MRHSRLQYTFLLLLCSLQAIDGSPIKRTDPTSPSTIKPKDSNSKWRLPLHHPSFAEGESTDQHDRYQSTNEDQTYIEIKLSSSQELADGIINNHNKKTHHPPQPEPLIHNPYNILPPPPSSRPTHPGCDSSHSHHILLPNPDSYPPTECNKNRALLRPSHPDNRAPSANDLLYSVHSTERFLAPVVILLAMLWLAVLAVGLVEFADWVWKRCAAGDVSGSEEEGGETAVVTIMVDDGEKMGLLRVPENCCAHLDDDDDDADDVSERSFPVL